MISKKTVIENNPQYKTLINAVVNSIGLDAVQDVNRHGIDGGFNGFIYYSDTHSFAMRYRKLIVKLLEETADMLGEDVVNMVCNFRCLREVDSEDKKELYKYLGGGRNQQSSITNAMAWFAAEEVCRMFQD